MATPEVFTPALLGGVGPELSLGREFVKGGGVFSTSAVPGPF